MAEHPEGVVSLLDTDLYKITMGCAIYKYFPDLKVSYAFTNRTPQMRLNREAFRWLEKQVAKLENIALSEEEMQFLKKSCPYLHDNYLTWLQAYRFQPKEHIKLEFTTTPPPSSDQSSPPPPTSDTTTSRDKTSASDQQQHGDLGITISGPWIQTIFYEIPLLALVSEAYFRFIDVDWVYNGQEENAYAKATTLLRGGCAFSEFGTRRRRDYRTQDEIMRGLVGAAKDFASWVKGEGEVESSSTSKKETETQEKEKAKGILTGTSNVHFAMKYGITPIGTVAHEWFMGIAAETSDYEHASEIALRYWTECFGKGVLGIALTDTFGTPTFLKAFRKTFPENEDPKAEGKEAALTKMTTKHQTYAQFFAGVRQDSGDPYEYVKTMRAFYDGEGITGKGEKSVVFSDSLNVEKCLELKAMAEGEGFKPSFGIGTFLTNDFVHQSDGSKSVPLNIVIKLSSAAGRPAIKISDNIGKNTGDQDTVQGVKKLLGYEEKGWEEGDEKTRWGK
ncbi:nicotinate phosphoribosyltransferase [Agyrium rufum]|nr:nicotinate phosphoribosyltransferase [Agyrium rufum]